MIRIKQHRNIKSLATLVKNCQDNQQFISMEKQRRKGHI